MDSERLTCDYCGSSLRPEEHPESLREAKSDAYETSTFTCPDCGGEISSPEGRATDFCPYCGGSVIMKGRMTEERKPDFVSPFRISKKECRKRYSERAGKVWCLPKALKDESFVDKFIGTYVPYYAYEVSQNGSVQAERAVSSGDETKYYSSLVSIKGTHDRIEYDASALFDDELSAGIGGFEKENEREFSPAYLCGFYADVADVPPETYEEDAKETANAATVNSLLAQFSGTDMTPKIPSDDKLSTSFGTKVERIRTALLPVWFLTWRNGDRVAYAVANGETGDVEADFPVDVPKFLLFSLLFALPFFGLFMILPTLMPETTLELALFAASLMSAVFAENSTRQTNRDLRSSDKGFRTGIRKESTNGMRTRPRTAKRKSFRPEVVLASLVPTVFAIAFCLLVRRSGREFLMLVANVAGDAYRKATGFARFLVSALGGVSAVVLVALNVGNAKRAEKAGIVAETLPHVAGIVFGIVVLTIYPVEDLWFYLATAAVLVGTAVECLFMIRRYNLLCTKPIPSFSDRIERESEGES